MAVTRLTEKLGTLASNIHSHGPGLPEASHEDVNRGLCCFYFGWEIYANHSPLPRVETDISDFN